MAIRISDNKITIGNFTLEETADGLVFNGIVRADSYSRVRAFQGTVAGFTSGGWVSPTTSNVIDKFPFPADGNATDVGDLIQGRYGGSGSSSSTHGYMAGGATSPPTTSVNTIDKFLFSSNLNAFNVGNLITSRYGSAGQSSQSQGYASGGFMFPTPNANTNVIERFPFVQDAQTFDVADLTVTRRWVAGHSSTEKGYTSGGYVPPNSNVIDSFPFVTGESLCTDVGDLTAGRNSLAGHSSLISGYASGGLTPTRVVTIDKFPFATNSNATNVGNLTAPSNGRCGTSSDLNGYAAGGEVSGANSTLIEKFSFVTDANATPVGNLTVARSALNSAGNQF